MPLIKSANVPTTVAAFSMRDVENAAKGILLRARQQAEALLAAAQQEADAMREQAYAEGLAAGQRDGVAQGQEAGAAAGAGQALAEHQAQLTGVVTALTAAATELDAQRRDLEAAGLREVIELSAAIARRVTKRQGLIDPDVLTDNLREAMNLVAHAADVRVAIHPSQKATLDATLPALRLSLAAAQARRADRRPDDRPRRLPHLHRPRLGRRRPRRTTGPRDQRTAAG
jgi:flagellar biosynthesis/type III secretory pathway protein FliH